MIVSFKNPREEEKISNVNYSDERVLIGNWLQRRYQYRRHNIKKESAYSIDYKPPRIDYEGIEDNAELVANKVTEGFGTPVADSMADQAYACNYLTLYDINYNNVWKKLGGITDYTLNKVNGVNRGLKDYKIKQWECENSEDDRFLSTFKKDFIHHKPYPKYPRRRVEAKAVDKHSVCRMFVDAMNLKTREERICFCPSHPEVCAIKPRNPGNIIPY